MKHEGKNIVYCLCSKCKQITPHNPQCKYCTIEKIDNPCEVCGKEKEFFGKRFQIRNNKKYEDSFYICMKYHVPFSKFTMITKEVEK